MTETVCSCGCAPAGATGTGGGSIALRGLSRRTVLTGSAAVFAGLTLTACSSPADTSGSTPTPTTGDGSSSTPTTDDGSSSTPTADDGADGERLASTADLAVGGGVILTASVGPVVVTHPTQSEFKAFDGRCPHQGCPVSSVASNTITCTCHGSTFDAATGDRTGGPAPTGLTPLNITVEDDAVYLA